MVPRGGGKFEGLLLAGKIGGQWSLELDIAGGVLERVWQK